MPDDKIFNTTEGETIARKLLLACLNVGTKASPIWSPMGKRVTDSSMEYDWNTNSERDILGNVNNTMDKPVVSQSFDPVNLDSAEAAYAHIWNLGVKEQNNTALANQDILIVHFYAGQKTAPFAERYPSSMIEPTSLGGESTIDMPFNVTGGGERSVGTATKDDDGNIVFTPDSAAAASLASLTDEY